MGLIVDLIIIGIICLSAFLAYRKGLVSLAINLCAFVIAIVVTLMLYKPVSNVIINVTNIDETIQNIILEKANDVINENETNEVYTTIVENTTTQMLPEAAKELSINIVTGGVALIIFILAKIALRFVKFFANLIAKLPIIKQINKLGGVIYGIIRGLLIVYVALLLISLAGQINPQNAISQKVNNSYVGKIMYENNILNILF